MSKIKVGVIGAGGIVRRLHLPDLDQNDNFEVVLISGRKESRLKQQCEVFGIPNLTQDYEAVISDDSVDAIVVGTPHPHHVSWGIKAIETGKHVLMQKPLCGDMNEANAFVEAVEKSKQTVMCLPHFSSQVYKIRQMITEGAIGRVSGARYRTSHGGPEIYYAEVRDLFGETDDDLWFFDAKRAGGGALFDMGVYPISHLVAILGSFAKVTGFVTTFDKPTDLEDVATLVLKTESGAIIMAETSWCDPARTGEGSIHGTAGKFTISGRNGAAVSLHTPTSYTRENAPVDVQPVKCEDANPGNMHQHFADHIRAGTQPPLSNAQAARHVTEIMLAGMESSLLGQAINLKTRVDNE